MKIIKEYARKSDATKLANKLNKETEVGRHEVKTRKSGKFAVYDLKPPVGKKAAKKSSSSKPKTVKRAPSAAATSSSASAKATDKKELTTRDELPREKTNPVGDINPLRGKSTIQSPVSQVWEICEGFYKESEKRGEKISRKRVIDFCVSQGIAFYTARTQYQAWKTAQNI